MWHGLLQSWNGIVERIAVPRTPSCVGCRQHAEQRSSVTKITLNLEGRHEIICWDPHNHRNRVPGGINGYKLQEFTIDKVQYQDLPRTCFIRPWLRPDVFLTSPISPLPVPRKVAASCSGNMISLPRNLLFIWYVFKSIINAYHMYILCYVYLYHIICCDRKIESH